MEKRRFSSRNVLDMIRKMQRFRGHQYVKTMDDALVDNCSTIMLACLSSNPDVIDASLSFLHSVESSRDITNQSKGIM